MGISISLEPSAEQELRDAFGDALDQTAFEALLLEGYRSGRLSSAQIGRILGLGSRWEVEEWLGQRGAVWNYSLTDLQADRVTTQEVSGDTT